MSTPSQIDNHGHAAVDDHHHHADAASHGTFKSYMTGFVLSVVLTAIPFWLVMGHVFESGVVTAVLVMAFLGAAMWLAFKGMFQGTTDKTNDQVELIGG